MKTQHLFPRPAAIVCCLIFLLGGFALAGDGTAPAQPDDVTLKDVNDVLNPGQTCPECGAQFREDRSMLMLLIGFLGQMVFTSRFLVQWIASEKRKQSYVPVVFWYLSIGGSLLLLAYAISIMAWPIILGQCFGVIVYGRNLALIARHQNAPGRNMPPQPGETGDAE